jgi:hypothetical protein
MEPFEPANTEPQNIEVFPSFLFPWRAEALAKAALS